MYVCVLPQASVAVQVLVIILLNPVVQFAGLSVLPVSSTPGVPAQLSVAVGVTTAGIGSSHLMSTLGGVVPNTGLVTSIV